MSLRDRKPVRMGERIIPRPSRRKCKRFDHGEPIWRIDTRPMVFVFGFIALIILLPASVVRTHYTELSLWDGQQDAWWTRGNLAASEAPHEVERATNRVTLTNADQILWNGEAISMGILVTLLEETKTATPEPIVEFEPAPNASYNLSAQVILIMKSSGKIFQIAGLEKHCRFDSELPPIAYGNAGTLNIAYSMYFPPESDFSKTYKNDNLSDRENGCQKTMVVHQNSLAIDY